MPTNLFLQTQPAGGIADLFDNAAADVQGGIGSFPGAAPQARETAPAQSPAPAQQPLPKPAPGPGNGTMPTPADLVKRARELGVDEGLAMSIFGIESNGNWKSRDSSKGAKGGMQVMPDTYKQVMGTYDGQSNPWNNMEAGLRYLRYGMDTLGTSDPKLIAAGYQAGFGNKDVRAGRLPTNVSDGNLTPEQYATKVAGKMGLGGNDSDWEPISAEEAQKAGAAAKQEPLGDEWEPISEADAKRVDSRAYKGAKALLGEAGFLGADLKIGWNNLLSSLQGIKQEQHAELLDTFTKEHTPEQIAADPKLQAEYKARADNYAQVTKDIKARGEKTAELMKDARPETQEFLASGQGDDAGWNAKTLNKIGSAVMKNPVGVVADLGLQSAPQMVAMMAAAVFARVSGMGAGGAALAGGATSGALQFGSDYSDLRADGMSHEEAFKTAAAKASVVGAFDAVSMGSAGHAIDTVMKKSGAITLLDKAKSVAKKAGTVAAETGKQAGLGMGGEAFGSLASGRTPNPTDVAAEGLGELAGAPFEGMTTRAGKPKAAPTTQPGAAPAAPVAPAPAPVTGPLTAAVATAAQTAAPAAPSGTARVVTADDGAQNIVTTGPNGPKVTPVNFTKGTAVVWNDGKTATPVTFEALETDPATGEVMATVQREGKSQTVPFSELSEAPSGTKVPTAEQAAREAEKKKEAAPEAAAPAKIDLATLSDEELTNRNGYLAEQARANGGWNKVLSGERRRIEAEVKKRAAAPKPAEKLTPEQIATNKEDALYPRVVEMLKGRDAIRPQDIMAATDVGYARAARALETAEAEGHVGALQEDGTRPVTVKEETNAVPAEVASGGDAAVPPAAPEQPAAPAAAQSGPANDAGSATDGNVASGKPATALTDEPLYEQAKQAVIEGGTGSISLVQRKLKIGYNRAARLLEQMEADGIVGPQTTSGRREVLAKPEAAPAPTAPESAKSGTTPAAEPAKDVAAGKWFGSAEKAQAFIDKKGLIASHDIAQTGKVRFEIKPKAIAQVDAAAHEAATSPRNDLPAPTQAQIEAGNYKKGHINVQGLDISVENPAGSTRSGKREDGSTWAHTMSDQYGYVRGTEGADGDHVDVYVGKHPEAPNVYVIDQLDQQTGKFDEHKAMIGFHTEIEAVHAYKSNFDKGWKVGPVAEMPIADFKDWLKNGDTTKPAAEVQAAPEVDRSPEATRAAALDFVKAARERGAKKAADIMPGIKGNRTFQTGAPLVKPGFLMVDGPKGQEFKLSDLWKEAELPAKKAEAEPKPVTVKKVSDGITAIVIDPSAGRADPVKTFGRAMKNSGLEMNGTNPRDWSMNIGERGEIHAEMTQQRGGNTVYELRRMLDGETVETLATVDVSEAAGKIRDMRTDALADERTAKPAANDGAKPSGTDPFAGNKVFTADKVAAARERLRSKLGQLNSGFDPEMAMDGLTIAGAYIESGVRSFSDYAAAMTADLGDAVKPYLLSFWNAVRDFPGLDTEGMTSAVESKQQHDALMAKQSANQQEAIKDERRAATESPAGSNAGVRTEAARADESAGATDRVSRQPAGADVAGDQRPDAGGNARARDAGKPAVRAEPAEANAADQHGDEQRNGDSARASDGNDQGAKSRVGNDHRIRPGDLKREGSWRATAVRNVDIVELAKKLTEEGRAPTPDEQALLARFTGWGASEIANGIFPDKNGRYKDSQWQALGERLKSLLTPEQYDTAKRTTQYAHYTSEGIISGIYRGFERMGFGGGKMLEPGMGVGSFKGLMPAAMAASSHYTGIEMDPVTGMIAKLLYPQSNIINGDFTKTALPRDYFDAAIGNPPFGQITISNDPEYRKNSFLLHDYFFAKTLDRVKPGGMLVFVTSKGTMDKGSDRARAYLADRANLVGAIRLPQTAFKDNAGTEVVTDVLFLQKRGPGIEDNGVQWRGTAEVKTPQGPATINEYFAAHPEQVLGANALTGSMYRANEYTVIPEPGVDLDAAFAKAVERLPENLYKAGAKNPQAAKAQALQRDFNPLNKKEGGVYVGPDGTLMQTDNGSGVPLEARRGADGKEIALKPKEQEFLKSWAGLRDALKQAQLDQLTNGDWESSLKALNTAYDAFVVKHGNLLDYSTITRTDDEGNTTETKRFKNDPLLRLDVDGPLAYSLEHITQAGDIVKAPVLSERVLEQPREPEIKTTNDALFVSLNNLGRLDLDDVAKLASMSRDEVIDALGTSIYEDPATGWQTSDEYLSGNVVRKLKEVQAAAKTDKRFARNVDALLSVQPKPLGPSDITVKLGQNWLPPKDVAQFATEALGEKIAVNYNERTGQWSADQSGSNMTAFNGPRMDAGMILENVLNNKQLKITFRDAEGKTHVDAESTEKVNDIANKMRAAFSSWIWTDTGRADRLVNYYNEHFNNIAPRQFDGSHLTLPGVSMRFDLRPNQKRAIWRAIQQGDTYLAHAVGAGKTFEMIAIGMEERRLGLSNKPMYAVPNHMLAQFAREFLELYPAANIMVADEQNFHTHNRRKFVAQAALNNPDAVIITHSAFGRIGMSDEFASKFIKDQIDEWQAALDETDKSDRVTTKQIQKRIEQLERRLEARQSGEKKDRVMSFEELGVDRLLVDEIHEFRKLDFATNQGNIKGIDPAGSQRSLDLYMKKKYLDEKNPGRALVGASGTPVTNTMGELFTVQRLFQAKQLEEDGLHNFDAWSNQYGDIVAGFEQNAAGGYEIVSRFAKFQNVPELMRRVRSFMDILTSQQLSQYVERPNVKTGGRDVRVTPSPFGYKEYQKTLERRIDAIRKRKGPPKKGDDIILKVISDGRFSAIDMRFVDPSAPSDPNSKLNQMLAAVAADYHAAADFEYTTNGKVDPNKGASHIIFTDIGLGEQSAETRGFDMKAWMEHSLVEAGVKREHIAFIRDYNSHAKKERLFAAMRAGEKRILIGGKDMETGVNVQKRLYTEEHLDAPWFPASVEQREGRIVRQGNQNKVVGIRAWATKGSYDATMWGMNARKARFIEQALTGDDSVRSLEDVSEASAFEMAAALASGDERYMKLAGLKADVERLDRLASAHHDEQNKLRRDKNYAEHSIEVDQKLTSEIDEAMKVAKPIRAGEFAGTVGNVTITDRAEFGPALFNRFKELAEQEKDTTEQIGEIGGFAIMYDGIMLKGSSGYNAAVTIKIPGDPNPLISLPLDPDMPIGGIATRAANQVNNLESTKAQLAERIKINSNRLKAINGRIGAVFPEQGMLLEKVAELHNLQDELTKEKAAENAPAPSAEAAAATAEVEGKPAEKFSAAPSEERKPVATLNGDELGSWKDVQELGERARAWYASHLVGNAVENREQHWPVHFSKAGMGKTTGAARKGADLLRLIPALPAIIEKGRVVESMLDVKSRPNIKAFHKIAATVILDGTPQHVIATIREDNNGHYHYDLSKDSSVGARTLPTRGGGRPAGVTHDGLASGLEGNADNNNVGENESERNSVVMEGDDFNIDFADATIKTAEVRRALTGDKELGAVAQKLLDSGSVVLHDTAQKMPSKNAASKQGMTEANGTIHLAADNLTTESAIPVLLHEAFHSGAERLMSGEAWAGLMNRLNSLYRQAEHSTGRARKFFDAARASVDHAGTPRELTAEEFGAYTVEHYDRAPAAFLRWVDDIAGTVKAWALKRFDKQLGAVTPAQLRALAKAALLDGKMGDGNGPKGGERFSTPAGTPGAASQGLTPPEPGRFERFQARVQDAYNRVKKVQQRIEQLTGAPLPEYDNYYQAETNRPGRTAARKEDAERRMFNPLMADLAKAGRTPDQLANLLHAMHAQERNAKIATINDKMPDGGSGMTTADANAILAQYAGDTVLHALAQRARGIAKATLQLKLHYGLIDQEAYDALDQAYQNYVPLKGDMEPGPKVKRAMGHSTRDEYILENIARDYDQAVVAGEKNLARQSLLSLVADNPDDTLWTIGMPPKGRYIAGKVYSMMDSNGVKVADFTSRSQVDAFLEGKGAQAVNYSVVDSNGERVAEFTKPLQDNEVMVYVDGQPVRIQIKDLPLAAQLRPLDGNQMNWALSKMRDLNRYFSKIYTGYNPLFMVRNAIRDFGTGSVNMIGNQGIATAAKAWANYPVAFLALGQWAATGKAPTGRMGTYLNEYRAQGGKMGASWMSDLDAHADTLQKAFDDAYGAKGFIKEGRYGKAAMIAGRKFIGGLAHVIEVGNQAAENALRLGLYAALRSGGDSPGTAAAAAKNVTVDFDRKGSVTNQLGSLYLFFNPAVQGSANAIRTLAKGEHKYQAMAALALFGALGFALAAGGMDDDKERWLGTPWSQRTSNLRINIGKDKTLTIPISMEYAPVFAMGTALAEMTRGVSPTKTAARVFSSFMDAFFPLKGAYDADSDKHGADAVQAVLPTVLKPAFEMANNRTAYGTKIVPSNDRTEKDPSNLLKHRGSEGNVYDTLAQSMAKGGEYLGMDRYGNDITKLSPETLKYLWSTYTGGVGNTIVDFATLGKLSIMDPASVEASDVPFVKDFAKEDAKKNRASYYFDQVTEAKEAQRQFQLAKTARDADGMVDVMSKPGMGLALGTVRMSEKVSKTLKALGDQQVAVLKDESLSVGERRAKLKEIEATKDQLVGGVLGAITQ